ncbi:MAG: WXG100 family type VII secretion target [Austwickia sp.]|nr:WXG100 family type VII secretion target [Austwickia sp.]MCO5308218.1 WXG100 family type VII secretion target [Austwickia sp.]
MSTQFQVDTQQIAAASGDIRRMSGQIESDVASMMARLSALQNAWRGSAAAGFQQVVTQWSATQRQVRESLDAIETTLARAGTQYADVEAANAALFARR